jgi:hypothetical protein
MSADSYPDVVVSVLTLLLVAFIAISIALVKLGSRLQAKAERKKPLSHYASNHSTMHIRRIRHEQ